MSAVSEAADVVAVTNSAGWRIVSREVDAALKEIEGKAWKASSDAEVLAAHREATGARQFWRTLQNRLQAVASYENYQPDNAFAEVSMM